MSAELIGVLSVGVALGLLMVALWRSTNARIDRLEDRFQGIETRMDERFGQMNGRFGQIDERFGQIDQRFGQIDERFGQIDEHFRQVDDRFGRMEAEMNARFGRMEDQFNARFERLEGRFETYDARQYEMAQALARIEARQIDAAAPESEGERELVRQGTEVGGTD